MYTYIYIYIYVCVCVCVCVCIITRRFPSHSVSPPPPPPPPGPAAGGGALGAVVGVLAVFLLMGLTGTVALLLATNKVICIYKRFSSDPGLKVRHLRQPGQN